MCIRESYYLLLLQYTSCAVTVRQSASQCVDLNSCWKSVSRRIFNVREHDSVCVIIIITVNLYSAFLSRVSTRRTRDIHIAILSARPSLSVCLSVRLSVRNVPLLDENGLIYRHIFFTIR